MLSPCSYVRYYRAHREYANLFFGLDFHNTRPRIGVMLISVNSRGKIVKHGIPLRWMKIDELIYFLSHRQIINQNTVVVPSWVLGQGPRYFAHILCTVYNSVLFCLLFILGVIALSTVRWRHIICFETVYILKKKKKQKNRNYFRCVDTEK